MSFFSRQPAPQTDSIPAETALAPNALIGLRNHRKILRPRHEPDLRAPAHQPRRQGGRVHLDHGAVGRRQVDAAAHHRHARQRVDGRVLLPRSAGAQAGAKDRAKLHKQYIGFVFQSYHLLDHLTVYENLDIPLSYRDIKKSERESMVCDILDKFAIVGKKDLYPNQLSGGQQQLVAVARAVISNPKVILADEPTGNLHSSQGKEIMELFKKLNESGHHDHPGDALGSERGLRQPDHPAARRLGRGRIVRNDGALDPRRRRARS